MPTNDEWYYADQGKSVGPVTLEELVKNLPRLQRDRTMVYGPNCEEWREARFALNPAVLQGMQEPVEKGRAFDVDYEIRGEEMQYIEISLDSGEKIIAEPGAMMYMGQQIEMQTVLGDPAAEDTGFFGKLASAGKRILTGESLFISTFENRGHDRDRVAFASPYPGRIIPMHLDELGGEVICQKDAFLCATLGVQLSIAFRKKMLAGFFGGEGFIMQRIKGKGVAFVHAGGMLSKHTLQAGELLKIDTGCLVAMSPSVDFDVKTVGGVKNALFGGEGLFLGVLQGPGDVWLQSLPFSRLAAKFVSGSLGSREGK